MKKDGTFETLSKKEKLQVDRLRAKLEKNLGSITEMTRLPGALFVVDIKREHIAINEASKLKIPIFAMVDTNSDPREVDFVIPSNDDASKSIEKILGIISAAVAEGLQERKNEKDAEAKGEDMDDSDDTLATEEVTETPKAQEKSPKVAVEESDEEEDEAKPAKKSAAKKTTAKKPAAKKEK
jgi:small subunit ribosomal protein S2